MPPIVILLKKKSIPNKPTKGQFMNKIHQIENLKDLLSTAVYQQVSDNEVLQVMKNLVDFIYDNFQDAETGNNALYFSQQFELQLTRLSHSFLFVCEKEVNPKYHKSQVIKDYILTLASDPKYKNARAEFIRHIGINWAKELVILALNDALWENNLINFELLTMLNQKRVGGFENKAQTILENSDDPKSELAKICQRYLKNSVKFKHYYQKVKL